MGSWRRVASAKFTSAIYYANETHMERKIDLYILASSLCILLAIRLEQTWELESPLPF